MPLNKKQVEFLKKIDKNCIHGKNILAKRGKEKIEVFFTEYEAFYHSMQGKNGEKRKIQAFIKYKNFAFQNNKTPQGKPFFSPQSKFEPTILEEFLFHMFRDYTKIENINVGSVKAYNNLYFSPSNLTLFKKKNFIKINQKDQDFSIYKKVKISDDKNLFELSIPIVSIECKTYLDKTMLEGSIATAAKIKSGNPHCKFYIVTETYEVDYKVDPSTSRIDNIFVLKKGGRAERNNTFHEDVFIRLYEEIKKHLNANWSEIKTNIEEKGTIF